MTRCGFSTSACRISSTRGVGAVIALSLARGSWSLGALVGPQPLGHRRDHLERQTVVPFDRIGELPMAEHHGLDGTVGNHGRGRRSSIQHADFAEEVTRAQLGCRLAAPCDLHVATLQDEEGLGWLPLGYECLTRLETD